MMNRRIVPTGTTVHVDGVPYRLVRDTEMESATATFTAPLDTNTGTYDTPRPLPSFGTETAPDTTAVSFDAGTSDSGSFDSGFSGGESGGAGGGSDF